MQIGVVEGDSAYQLYRVRDAVRLSDGRLAVANGGSREVRFYDAKGQYLEGTGRSGRGPGEFMSLGTLMRLAADSLIIVDFILQRCTLLDPSGSVVAIHPCEGPVGTFPDGSALRQARATPERADVREGVARDEAVLIRYGRDGIDLDTLARLPGDESVQVVQLEGSVGGVTGYARPFALKRLTSVSDGRVYTGDGAEFEVRVLDMGGQLLRVIRLNRAPRPVTAADQAAYREQFLGGIPAGPYRARAERALAGQSFPVQMPLFQRLLHDRIGNLWVEAYQAEPTDPAQWDVFDEAGTWMCTLATPPGLTITEIGPDYILGISRDDLDVEHVQLYELHKNS